MTIIYNAAEFRKAYGKNFKASPGSLDFDEKDVPAAVTALIPYARYWGLTDDAEVGDLLEIVAANSKRLSAISICQRQRIQLLAIHGPLLEGNGFHLPSERASAGATHILHSSPPAVRRARYWIFHRGLTSQQQVRHATDSSMSGSATTGMR